MLVACGNGDDSSSATPNKDAGEAPDTSMPGNDALAPVPDAGDASTTACNFATFVKGLVAMDTTMTALPSTNLGQTCTDDHDQAEFQSLFP
jgi:hypothetical protein